MSGNVNSRGLAAASFGLVIGAVFFLAANHFLSPPDCAFYWAWAESLARQGNFDFGAVYERLHMPTLYVWLTPAQRLSNDWPIGSGLVLLPVVRLGPAMAHAWMVLWVAAALAAWWRFAPFGRGARWLAVVATVVGSPLLFYTLYGPFFSHAVSFAAVTAFTILWDKTRSARSIAAWLLLGLVLGFAMTIRPQNALLCLVLLPELLNQLFRWGSLPKASHLALFAGSTLLGFAPQMLAWWAIYGSPFSLPKMEEMQWFRPNLLQLLLSDFHGVLPWTPIYGVAALGIGLLAFRDKVLAAGLALVVAAQVYVNAANLVWWSGGSFGNRRLTDYAIVVAYGVAALWDARKRSDAETMPTRTRTAYLYKIPVGMLVLLCGLWTLTLLLAERRGLLPLDRYVPLYEHRTIANLLSVWTELPATVAALLAPMKEAGSQIGVRLAAAIALGIGTAAILLLIGIQRLTVKTEAITLTIVASVLAATTAIAGLRTRAVTDPSILKMVRKSPGILWDNYIELALYEIVQRRPLRAETAVRKAIAIRPDHYSNYWYLAAALRDQRRFAEAAAAYTKVLDLYPEHPAAARERDAMLAAQFRF